MARAVVVVVKCLQKHMVAKVIGVKEPEQNMFKVTKHYPFQHPLLYVLTIHTLWRQTPIRVDRTVRRQQRDMEIEVIKEMEPRQEMFKVTNPNTVWRDLK